jgi:hypothetical protein
MKRAGTTDFRVLDFMLRGGAAQAAVDQEVHKMQDPQTPAEWQEAVNLARFLLDVEASKSYGLLAGGPATNVARCEELLKRGKDLGFHPAPTVELVKQFVAGPASE